MATAREHAFAGFPAALSDTARAALERAAAPVAPSAVLAGGVAAASAACDAAARRLRVPSLVLDAEASRGGEQEAGAAPIVQPKLSKKQKRAAHQQRKRDGLCGNVVATGDPAACPYGDRCKFSHDVEAYRARKPADLPGRRCPFVHPCPFGVSCRLEGGHAARQAEAEAGAAAGGEARSNAGAVRGQDTTNTLPGAFSESLRKNRYDFGRADASTREAGATVSLRAFEAPDEEGYVPPYRQRDGAPAAFVYGAADTQRPALGRERRPLDLEGKLYMAPLTTLGNLPFRRLCVELGIDITVGEMAMATNLLQGQRSEWALLKRHSSEKCFGAQICGQFADSVARACQLIEENTDVDFIDLNCGCPIDLVCNAGAGAAMLRRPKRMETVIRAGAGALRRLPFTVKTRTGFDDKLNVTHTIAPRFKLYGAAALTLHGRTRQQRYSRPADWSYVAKTAAAMRDEAAAGDEAIPLVGNGDVYTFDDYYRHVEQHGVATCMLARGMLIKPWLATEIKERRHWDISGSERFELLRKFADYALEHWGTDDRGVENARRFLLEWLSFTHRYVPIGLLEAPCTMAHRPPPFVGRDDREMLLASPLARDWVRITEMVIGPTPKNFVFAPKHKSAAFESNTQG